MLNNDDFLFSVKVGTPLYNAPEQESSGIYDYRADCFALGLILFEALSSFKTMSERIKTIHALKQTGKIDPKFVNNFPYASKVIDMLIQRDYEKRPFSENIQTS